MKVGIYNPILEKNILKILNYKLEMIDIIDLNKYLKYGELWNLNGDSDVMNGKIYLIKFVPWLQGKGIKGNGDGNGRFKFVGYSYDVKTKKFSIITSKP